MRRRHCWLWIAALLLVVLGLAAAGGLSPYRPQGADSTSLGLLLLDAEDGVHVLAVTEGSEADEAGVMPGDRILALDGVLLPDVAAFNDRLTGSTGALQLTVCRDEQELRLMLRCR